MSAAPPPPELAASPGKPGGSANVTVIRPRSGWRALGLREVWEHREVLGFLALRDVKVRYRQTVLGVAWAMLQPSLLTAAFAFVLAKYASVPSGGLPYPLVVYAGMLPWTFFSTALLTSGQSVVAAERVVTKVWFPRLCIPFGSVAACLVDFALAAVPLVLLMLWYGVAPGPSLVWAPVLLACLVLLALGLGALFSAMMVAWRDVRFVLPFLVQILLFATPAVYLDSGGAAASGLLRWHPLQAVIGGFRASLLGGAVTLSDVAIAAGTSLACFVAGCLWFRNSEDAFADVI